MAMRHEILVATVILLVVCVACLATCTDISRKEPISVHESGRIRASHERRGFRGQEGHAAPSRSRSYLEVSPLVNGSATEAELLLAFRKEIVYDPLNSLSGWNNNNISNYCNWTGIECGSSSSSSSVGHVIALNLSGYGLWGIISPSLGSLRSLQSLDLSDNLLEGGIPTSIANCSNLSVLDLSLNAVGGVIPMELAALSNLQELNLSENMLTGAIAPSFSNLSALRVLDLSHNQLQGDILSLAWGGFGKLETLRLTSNGISGAIPESLGNCTSLIDLSLSVNDFSGFVPDIFGGLQNLETLDLEGNMLMGSIPTSLGGLKALSLLQLGQNLLVGEIPDVLGDLLQLTVLDLRNNDLKGPIPASLLNCSSLAGLFLQENRLSGLLPADIGLLSHLQYLDLWNNSFTGAIPSGLMNCTSLTELSIGNNFFVGGIPQELSSLRNLKILALNINSFQGAIPASLSNISGLLEVFLDRNQLTSEIPPELGLLKSLMNLDLSSNFLAGQIPPDLRNLGSLNSLSLAKNQLSGQIPRSFGQLVNLQGLDLSGNHLTGGIPRELSHCTQLFVLDLSGNALTGGIPDEIGTLMALNRLYLNNNQFTGSTSPAIRQNSTSLIEINLAYNRFSGVIAGFDFGPLQNLQLMDLSNNFLSGALPSGIGALEVVQNINFSFNAFSGPITDAFSHCTGLRSLDLSSNDLDGQIPDSLTSLESLTYFNVSFNQLSGPVPSSGPFANFNSGSYLGNPELCGSALPKNCRSSCSGISCHDRLWIVIVPAVAGGSVAGLVLAAVWFLLVAKRGDSRGTIAPVVPNASPFTREIEGLGLADIVAATNGFSDDSIIGVGSKSTVFAGVLPSGVMIAVKRLELRSDDRATAQLCRELQRLSKMEHPNLLKIHGMFSIGDLRLLVLEYMPNGTLHKQIYDGGSCNLTWAQRLSIALEVAEGMVYLHNGRSKPVIHLDLKPSNILLDSNGAVKVSDYGISKYLNHESHVDTTISSNLYGTIGYIPPEYGALTRVSSRGDVYNFGVVLMELVTRKQPTDDMFGQDISLRSWVVDAFPSRISRILDSTLREELAHNEKDVGIHLIVRLAIACTRNTPKDRPTMMEARDMLLEIRSIEEPLKGGSHIESST